MLSPSQVILPGACNLRSLAEVQRRLALKLATNLLVHACQCVSRRALAGLARQP